MTDDISDAARTEVLYERLAQAIDAVWEGHDPESARDCEAQFLVKLAFLALRALGDADRQRLLIALAATDLAAP